MKYLLEISSDVVGRFEAPLNPRIFGGLFDDDKEINWKRAEAISYIFDPGCSEKAKRRIICIDEADEQVGSGCKEMYDDGWEDDSLGHEIVFIGVDEGA